MAILVVEDEQELSEILSYVLRRAGFEVLCAHDGMTALRRWRAEAPSLILLDINLPRIDGWEVCRQVRTTSLTPVIMLTGGKHDRDVIRGLNLGADDYITKPFSPAQLIARIDAVLRRTSQANGSARARLIKTGELELDLELNMVSLAGREVRLTNIEFRLLHALTLREGHVVRHRDLIQRVWGYEGVLDGRMLKSHIRNLRKKIEPDPSSPCYLHTIPMVGYRLTVRAVPVQVPA